MKANRVFHDIEQNTDEWMEVRRGKFTASSFKNLFATKSTAQYKKEVYRVAYEIVTGESPEFYSNDYMERGHDLEPFARKEYEMQTFNDVVDGGFVELNKFVGCSPDGFVGRDGIVQIKCPAFNTMIDYLKDGKVPSDYKWQLQGELYVTDRSWCDFFAYHPMLKPVIIRVYPDEKAIEQLEAELEIAIKAVQSLIKIIKK